MSHLLALSLTKSSRREISSLSSAKILSSNPVSTTAWASEKLPRLTGLPHTSLCKRGKWLAAHNPRIVRTAGLTNPKRKSPR